MRYKNKVDWWIALIIVAVVFGYFPIVLVMPQDEQWIILLTMGVMAVITLPFLYGYVELTDEELICRLGYIRYKVPYDKIKSVRLTTSFLSSMAMTTKRIEIREHNKSYIRGTTHIGPVDREEVYEELLRRCHYLEEDASMQ